MTAKVGMGQVWDKTTAFVEEHRGAVTTIAIVAILLPTVLSANLQAVAATLTGPASAALALFALVLTVAALWGQVAITALAVEPARGRAALAHATRRLPAIVGVSLVLLVALALLTVPVGVILAGYGVDMAAVSTGAADAVPAAAAAWTFVYLILILPVLLWLAARLLLLTPVILEERRGLGAIARAFRLTRGLGAKLVGVVLLYAIVSLVVVSAVQFVFGFLLALAAGGDGPVTVATVLTSVAVAAASTVLAVFQGAFVGVLYRAVASPVDVAEAFR